MIDEKNRKSLNDYLDFLAEDDHEGNKSTKAWHADNISKLRRLVEEA